MLSLSALFRQAQKGAITRCACSQRQLLGGASVVLTKLRQTTNPQSRGLFTTSSILHNNTKTKKKILQLGIDEHICSLVSLRPINEIAEKLNIPGEKIIPYGHYKAKIDVGSEGARKGKLVLVTAMSPTKAGEGKTTTSVGLTDGMNKVLRMRAKEEAEEASNDLVDPAKKGGITNPKKVATVALREPSLGPVFGMKGGGAGGGRAQVAPMQDINLHFNGDFHAISACHNLLSALLDNHIYFNKEPKIDSRRVTWKRVVDMNDRALRETLCGLTNKGGVGANGFPRQDGFDITVASEVMAILCLATDIEDLERRLGNIIIGYERPVKGYAKPVRARDIQASNAMVALLKDAMLPNLVQTLEHSPAILHGGPFANIAHGCNSIIATDLAMKTSEYVITEAGFGADLGAEKFLNIKCRIGQFEPRLAVMVATVRACKLHGGCKYENLTDVDKALKSGQPDEALAQQHLDYMKAGIDNVKRHVENLQKFGLKVIVAINKFPTDTSDEETALLAECKKLPGVVDSVVSDHWARGGDGALDLAVSVMEYLDNLTSEQSSGHFKHLYDESSTLTLQEKVTRVASEIYRAKEVVYSADALTKLKKITSLGDEFYKKNFPICIAKTQYSFSDNPALLNAPDNHSFHVTDIRLSAGAEFVVIQSGEIMTMPGLPKVPAACANVGITNEGIISIEGKWVDDPTAVVEGQDDPMLAKSLKIMRKKSVGGISNKKIDHVNDSKILSGKTLSKIIRNEIKEDVNILREKHGVVPGLAVVMVGSRPDSATYVMSKTKFAEECGFHVKNANFAEDASEEEVLEWIDRMNKDQKIHGILAQLPVPIHMSEKTITTAINIEKDVDGFTAHNIGATALKGQNPYAISCTPKGVIEMLDRKGVEISGKKAVVIGRSNIVGMPLTLLLHHRDATVVMCHSKTKNLRDQVLEADIVCAAIGRPHFIPGDWIKPGAVVIDIGINAVDTVCPKTGEPKKKLVGDVEFATAYEKASLITPVPGGVGPMTVTMLLQNTLMLAKRKLGLIDESGQDAS